MTLLDQWNDLTDAGVATQPAAADERRWRAPRKRKRLAARGAGAWLLLAAMTFVLFAGIWRQHPLVSLALPAVALVAWLPVIRGRRNERWLIFYVAGIYLYTVLRAFADEIGFPIHAQYTIQFDQWLFGNVPSLELQRDFFTPRDVDWLDLLTAGVHASFFIVPHAALVLIWWKRPEALRLYSLSVLIALYGSLALFFLVPTVPPWLAAQSGYTPGVYRVIDFVFSGVSADYYQDAYRALAEPNSVAAVPSVHMALTCVVLFRAISLSRQWVPLLTAYTLLMAFSLVYLGEHYVFDVLVGMLVALVAEIAIRMIERVETRRAERAG